MTTDEQNTIWVRRQWNDWRDALYPLDDIENPHWDNFSGGIQSQAPQYFIHGYVWCDAMIEGELAHSCAHGEGPHRIKICVVKSANSKNAYKNLLAKVKEPKPTPTNLDAELDALEIDILAKPKP